MLKYRILVCASIRGERTSHLNLPDNRRSIMSRKSIPRGPWENGLYDDCEYDAIVHEIQHGAYGRNDDRYFRIILWLVQKQAFLVTNIYSREDSHTALQRIWHFCQACGTSNEDFYRRLDEFKDRHIRITLTTISAARSGAQNPFSDVDRFLRPKKPLTKEQWAEYRQATDPKADYSPSKEKPEKKTRTVDLFAV